MTLKKRPAPGSTTARVWEIADEMARAAGGLPSGRDVVARYVATNGNEGTGYTQFSHWKRNYLAKARPSVPRDARPAPLKVGADGQLTLPADVLSGLGLEPGDRVRAQLEESELRLAKAPDWLEQARALVRKLDPGPGSWVDELIAERRTEAARE